MSWCYAVLLLVQIVAGGISVFLWVQAWRKLFRNEALLPFEKGGPRDLQPHVSLPLFLLCLFVLPGWWMDWLGAAHDDLGWNALYRLVISPPVFLVARGNRRWLRGEFPPDVFSGARWKRMFQAGTWGFFLSLLPVFLMFLVVQPYRSEHRLIHLLKEHGDLRTWGMVVVAAVVAAPVYEELMFRVLLQGACVQIWRPATAILGSALLFGACHGIYDALPIIPLGLVLGYVYYRTGSPLAVVWTHALFNGFNLLMFALRLGAGES